MDFQKVYSGLNKEQKEAVDLIEGPLLVLAGPGTGKTQLLSARVANILQKTDSSAENILCLTFTEKAAQNMKQRLLNMIGPDGRKVVVKTFHGLGAEIMNSNPDCFWNAARLEPAPEAVKLEIITEILNKLPLNNPLALKFSGQYTLVGDVLRAIGKTKEAGLSGKKLAALTEANLSYLESIADRFHPLIDERVSKNQIQEYAQLADDLPDQTHDEYTAPIPSVAKVLKKSLQDAVEQAMQSGKQTALSNWKKQWLETVSGQKVFKDIRKNQWWLELAHIYELYQKQMHQNLYFDFADMILEVITQLEQNETLRLNLQERFNYILLDEFQDTNDAQFRLSHLIANNPSSEKRPNIMAVGDDDQAIYRFQGANLSNARQFIESYNDTKLIVLTRNYRSEQAILDTAGAVAQQIEHRLINEFEAVDKNIVAHRTSQNGQVEHLQFPTQTEQYSQLAQKISNDRKNSIRSTVVLARKHESLENIAAELNAAGVPIRYERSSNILEHPVVQLVTDLTMLLEAIHDGKKDEMNTLLATILPHPAWNISGETLWRLALAQNATHINWLEALLEHEDENLKQLALWLLELAKKAQTLPLQVTIEHLLGLRTLDGFCSPIKNHYTNKKLNSDYIFSLTALERLRSLASEYSKQENAGLSAFIKYLKINKQHHVVLANEAAVITGEKPVELMTVHKAKGLEFDTVYVIDAIERHWQPSRRGRTPPSNLESLQNYGEESDDYARLLFVALTRAETNLIVSSFKYDEHGSEILPSAYIHHIPVQIQPSSGNSLQIAESTLRWPEIKHEKRRGLLQSRLENYQLSATGLIDFLDVPSGGPEHFINRHVLKLPDVRSATLSFGSAVHSALETAQRLINTNELKLTDVQASLKQALIKEHLESSEFERYLQHGTSLIEKLLKQDLLELKPGDYPERRISDVQIGSVFIKGVLDLVQVTPTSLRIVDYKTGRELPSLITKSQTEGVRAWKHKLQLMYYVLLATESGIAKPGQTISAEMIYVECDDIQKMRLAFTPSSEELANLKLLIQAVGNCLNAVDFPDISSYSPDLAGIQAFESNLIKSYNKKQ